MKPALLPCSWDPENPGGHGEPNHREVDPFQMVNELTAQDTQWRAATRLASMDLEFLRLSLENLGGSSREGLSAPTTG